MKVACEEAILILACLAVSLQVGIWANYFLNSDPHGVPFSQDYKLCEKCGERLIYDSTHKKYVCQRCK